MLANFFSRASVAAAQVLQGHDEEAFRKRMQRCFVAVAIDDGAARSPEGVVALEMTVDLLSRFYPGIAFIDLGDTDVCHRLVARLKFAATRVNHAIDVKVAPRKVSCCIVAGGTRPDLVAPMIFLGSNGWTARLSIERVLSSGPSDNPFGAAAAACFAVANAFRIVFSDQLPSGQLDAALDFDVLNCSRVTGTGQPDLPTSVSWTTCGLLASARSGNRRSGLSPG